MPCPAKLETLIEAPENLNFLVFETRGSTRLGQNKHSSPSPSGRQVTSSSSMQDDQIVVSGWVRCLSCRGESVDITDVIPRLKRTMERQKYTVDALIRLTSPFEDATLMYLTSVNADRDGNKPQELRVSMTFESGNFAGTIVDPNFTIGGIQ